MINLFHNFLKSSICDLLVIKLDSVEPSLFWHLILALQPVQNHNFPLQSSLVKYPEQLTIRGYLPSLTFVNSC